LLDVSKIKDEDDKVDERVNRLLHEQKSSLNKKSRKKVPEDIYIRYLKDKNLPAGNDNYRKSIN